MKEQMLSVNAIEKGIVIDHIQQGQGLCILRLLNPQNNPPITLGLNLKSASLGFKDLIKIENIYLSEEQTAQIALFSPKATVNIIEHYQVVSKYQVHLPEQIDTLLSCPNPFCITRAEGISPRFAILDIRGQVHLRCEFCEKIHGRDEMQ